MGFQAKEFFPGVYHIQDAMGVCMTLLCGENAALLVDTGYGLENVRAYVERLTDRPLTVMLTHGHHDHCLGARWFPSVRMRGEDEADFRTYTGRATRLRVLQNAKAKRLRVDEEAFLAAELPMPEKLETGEIDLGGLTARVLHCPGHTPGSCVVYVPEHALLLTGDDWNPCTWLFFEAALGVRAYRENMRRLMAVPFQHALCSHRWALYERETVEAFVYGLTDEALHASRPVTISPYEAIHTREARLPEGQVLVFDWDKAQMEKQGDINMEETVTRREVRVMPDAEAPFRNRAAFCVGTGRMGLALQKEYLDQLALVQRHCHFRYIRGHGLFSDDMAIYQTCKDEQGEERALYNFTYLDRVMDSYRALGLRPFLELGFMPAKLASGTQTVFYWRGQVTPPKCDEGWCALVEATLRHLCERYGADDVVTWPVEVWNEPNLPGFWENADKAKYLHLYEITARTVKRVDARFQVGGPAICGGTGSQEWVRDFLNFCQAQNVPVDFVSRHAYMGQKPERRGCYMYHTMCDAGLTLSEMRETREIMDSFPAYRALPMHITEFNTSYNSRCPIHDTRLNAAIIASFLACMGDVADSYSYWTFGDVFEEEGVPHTPFHGGFGLVADGLIEKPTLWTFDFFTNLKGKCVWRDEHLLVMRREDGSMEGIAWNDGRESHSAMEITLRLPMAAGRYALLMRSVDSTCDPLKAWQDMGQPASLNEDQLAYLRAAAQPTCRTKAIEHAGGEMCLTLALEENAVTHFTLVPAPLRRDPGYDEGWYAHHPEHWAREQRE